LFKKLIVKYVRVCLYKTIVFLKQQKAIVSFFNFKNYLLYNFFFIVNKTISCFKISKNCPFLTKYSVKISLFQIGLAKRGK